MVVKVGFIDGFDHYPSAVGTLGYGFDSSWIAQFSGGTGHSLTTGLNGHGLALNVTATSTGGSIRRTWGVESDKISFGIAFRITQLDSVQNSIMLKFVNIAAADQFYIGWTPFGILYVAGEGGAILAYGTKVCNVGVRYFLEIYADVTAGTIVVKILGQEQFSLSGVDLKDSSGNIAGIEFAAEGSFIDADNRTLIVWDDCVALYDEIYPIGEIEVFTTGVNADTADKDWAPLTGTDNYAMVDETQVDGDASYNSSNTPGALDMFTFADLSYVPDYVLCVSVVNCFKKEAASTRTTKDALRLDGSLYYGTDFNHSNDWTYSYYHNLVNPDTGLEWEYAEINSMEVGYELVL